MRKSRIRTVKPELFRHEELFDAELNEQVPARIAFVGLFTSCDREGRFPWQPRRLKADILPYDDVDMERVLNALLKYGFIIKYEHDGKPYGCIPTWLNHQRINIREAQSECPPPPGFSQPSEPQSPPESESAPCVEPEPTPAVNGELIASYLNAIWQVDQTFKIGCFAEERREDVEDRTPSTPTLPSIPFIEPTLMPNANFLESKNARARTCMHSWKGKEGKGMERNGTEENGLEEIKPKNKRGDQDTIVVSNAVSDGNRTVIEAIFSHWKTALNHPSAKLDDKRKALIAKALKFGYSQEQLCEAITGCSVTPHNLGDNEQGQRYDGLHIILRDCDQIDRFIHNAQNPPRRVSKGVRRTQSNVESLRFWAAQKMTEGQS